MSRSWIIAIVVVLAATAWVASGELFDSAPKEAPADPEPATAAEAPLPRVRVRHVAAEPMIDRLTLHGRTVADRSVAVRAETTGVIEAIRVERGARVEAGDVLARLAVEDRAARVAEARALLAQREIEFEAATKLNQEGYRADTALAEARAGLDAARAQLELAQLERERTIIRAPFAGIVNTRPVEVGDYVSDGDEIATVVDLDPIRVVGQASERHLGEIAIGDRGSVVLLDGTEIPGVVSYVGRVADDATRTFPVELEIPNPDSRIIAGITAGLIVPVDETDAYRLPPSVLSLDDDGTLGVKAVAADGTVVFHPVTLLGNAGDGVWLGGLPAEIDIVTVGHEFVTAGQEVDAVPADRFALDGTP